MKRDRSKAHREMFQAFQAAARADQLSNPVKVTAETITVVQLRWLRVNTGWVDYGAIDQETIARAMRGDRDARERCAAAWNARHGGES